MYTRVQDPVLQCQDPFLRDLISKVSDILEDAQRKALLDHDLLMLDVFLNTKESTCNF